MRWKNEIKIDLSEVVDKGVYLIQVAQDRDQWRGFINTALNFRFP